MSSSTWIAVYMPLFLLFFIFIPQNEQIRKSVSLRIKKRKDRKIMTNEVIKKYIGKNCKVYTGTFGTSVTGRISSVEENWLEIQTKKGIELINADFIYNIKIKG